MVFVIVTSLSKAKVILSDKKITSYVAINLSVLSFFGFLIGRGV